MGAYLIANGAAPIRAKQGQKMNTKALQWILTVLILGTVIKI